MRRRVCLFARSFVRLFVCLRSCGTGLTLINNLNQLAVSRGAAEVRRSVAHICAGTDSPPPMGRYGSGIDTAGVGTRGARELRESPCGGRRVTRTCTCRSCRSATASAGCSPVRRDTCRICTGTGFAPAASAPGLGAPLRHLHRDWVRPCHICTRTGAHPCRICAGTGPAPATSAHRDGASVMRGNVSELIGHRTGNFREPSVWPGGLSDATVRAGLPRPFALAVVLAALGVCCVLLFVTDVRPDAT
jgi:hypothetical protein